MLTIKTDEPSKDYQAHMTGLSGLSLKYVSQRVLNSGPNSLSSSSVGRICVAELIQLPNRTQLMTDLEPSVDSVGRQACPLGTDFPFGKDLEVESVCVVGVDGSSALLRFVFSRHRARSRRQWYSHWRHGRLSGSSICTTSATGNRMVLTRQCRVVVLVLLAVRHR